MMSNKLQKMHRQLHRLKVSALHWATVEDYAATYYHPVDLKAWRAVTVKMWDLPPPVYPYGPEPAKVSAFIEIQLLDGRIMRARYYDGNVEHPGWDTTIDYGPILTKVDGKIVVPPYMIHGAPCSFPATFKVQPQFPCDTQPGNQDSTTDIRRTPAPPENVAPTHSHVPGGGAPG